MGHDTFQEHSISDYRISVTTFHDIKNSAIRHTSVIRVEIWGEQCGVILSIKCLLGIKYRLE